MKDNGEFQRRKFAARSIIDEYASYFVKYIQGNES
jgi:hypothetical protein